MIALAVLVALPRLALVVLGIAIIAGTICWTPCISEPTR
jgi:uncharacterized membrane protein